MDFTVELGKSIACTPFAIMKEDKDLVIMMINYYIEKGETETSETEKKPPKKSDGFWDF